MVGGVASGQEHIEEQGLVGSDEDFLRMLRGAGRGRPLCGDVERANTCGACCSSMAADEQLQAGAIITLTCLYAVRGPVQWSSAFKSSMLLMQCGGIAPVIQKRRTNRRE